MSTGTSSIEIRQAFLDFFKQNGHSVVASSSLAPDDPTLLFTNAGMVQFKDTFLGTEKRSYRRATTSQKCMRVSGKHNDLENVGPSPRHHTFFEMLGNFSFGDYFKRDAIHYAWTFMTDVMGLPGDRIVATVYRDDDEAYNVWINEIGLPDQRVHRMGDKTNFWMMGDVGPCGPTSELHWDFGPEFCTCGQPDCSVALDNDCGRWLEVWNLVFMQFDQHADGARELLPKPGVDTGMGLERLCAVKQGVYANYETDLFVPIMEHTRCALADTPEQMAEKQTGYRVVADHGRAMTFLIADGVLPGNEGRGYVLRLIMRRAMRFGKGLGFSGPFLGGVAEAVIALMGHHYTELVERRDFILRVIAQEEERFQRTLDAGSSLLEGTIARLRAEGTNVIPGADVFRLYDTYGFPPDLTRVIGEEQGMTIDQQGFSALMQEQRERARAKGRFTVKEAGERYRRLDLPRTAFLGYGAAEADGKIVYLVVNGEPGDTAEQGDRVEIVLDRTPFYAEAGGQVGDIGHLIGEMGTVEVEDTQAPVPGIIVHSGYVSAGSIHQSGAVSARVNAERRIDIMRNHTATHLLHRVLQDTLGGHAQQRGSLVAPDHLRFDFAHLQALSEDELRTIEARVNALIMADLPVNWVVTSQDEARKLGAMMLFGEKYGDEVRMVTIGDGQAVSRELCGGTHLSRTGQIGQLRIIDETSVGAGLRRIEALTGRGAEDYVENSLDTLAASASALQTTPRDLLHRVSEMQDELKALQRELADARRRLSQGHLGELLGKAQAVDGVTVLAAAVDAPDTDAMREMADWLRDKLGSGIIVLGAVVGDKPSLVAAVTPDLVQQGYHAGTLVKQVASVVGGGGGGKPSMATAGGRDASKLGEALAKTPDLVRGQKK
ncbi:MAG: alanine--tRNA ligase [Anaerolineae bacterium]